MQTRLYTTNSSKQSSTDPAKEIKDNVRQILSISNSGSQPKTFKKGEGSNLNSQKVPSNPYDPTWNDDYSNRNRDMRDNYSERQPNRYYNQYQDNYFDNSNKMVDDGYYDHDQPYEQYQNESDFNNRERDLYNNRDSNTSNVADGVLSQEDIEKLHYESMIRSRNNKNNAHQSHYEQEIPREHLNNPTWDPEVEAAREILKKFNLKGLRITKKGGFDVRTNITKEYLSLCCAADVDPLDYYDKNVNQRDRDIYSSVDETCEEILSCLEEAPSQNVSQQKKAIPSKNSSADKRSLESKKEKTENVRPPTNTKKEAPVAGTSQKEIIARKIAEAKEKLRRFDLSSLKKTKDGNLDMRYKVNKEYLQLKKECEESYYY